MSEQGRHRDQAVHGTIRRRLLVNAVVDPDEAARRIPDGVRPHDTGDGTVVGCCLLEIDAIRPAGLRAGVGRPLRATAHRISVEWDDASGETVTGVYVPMRHTDSRLAAALGGRWFPGVHERAHIEIAAAGPTLRWQSDPAGPVGLGLRIIVTDRAAATTGATCDRIGATCLGASIGLSPDRRGRLEAARMEPAHRDARTVSIEELDSGFIDSFRTARLSTAFLMCDAEVTWTRATTPAMARAGAPA